MNICTDSMGLRYSSSIGTHSSMVYSAIILMFFLVSFAVMPVKEVISLSMGWFCWEHLQVKALYKHGNIGWFPVKIFPTNPSTDGLGIVPQVGKWYEWKRMDQNG